MDSLPGPSLESQIIFRLASLEATVNTSLKGLNEKLDNFQKDFNHKHVNTATQIAALDSRVDALKENFQTKLDENKVEINARVTKLEFFKTEILAKAAGLAFAISFVWMVFGDVLKRMIGM